MRKWTLLALTACLLLSGCGKQAAPAKEEAPQAAEPWRGAYIAFLEDLCEREKELRNTERPDYDPNTAELEIGEVSGRYVLYDIDKDAVPELLVRYGLGEAGYHTTVYGYRDGTVAELGDIPSGHTSFYTWPGENGLAYNWSHMGGHFIDKITLENGELVQTMFFEEGTGAWTESYTAAENVIPGSRYLSEVPTTVQLPELSPMTLPIENYGKVPLDEPLDPEREDAARAAITEVLENGGTFYAASADGFGGDAGETTLEAYLQPGGITEYADLPLSVTRLAWVDVDRDGASECLLRVEHNGGDRWDNVSMVVLSAQEGGVYGYCLTYAGSIQVLEDGVFRDSYAEGGSWGEMRLSFRENQCCLYTAPETSMASHPGHVLYGFYACALAGVIYFLFTKALPGGTGCFGKHLEWARTRGGPPALRGLLALRLGRRRHAGAVHSIRHLRGGLLPGDIRLSGRRYQIPDAHGLWALLPVQQPGAGNVFDQ